MRSQVQSKVLELARSQLDALELHKPAHRLPDGHAELAGGADIDLRDIRSGDVAGVLDAEADVDPPSPDGETFSFE
jgi:hypothetical protein